MGVSPAQGEEEEMKIVRDSKSHIMPGLLLIFSCAVLFLLYLPGRQVEAKDKSKEKNIAGSAWLVKPEWVRAHEEFLASDALAGRGSATRDEEIAATYVASEFISYGLSPAPGMQGYIQSADVVSPELDGRATLAAGKMLLLEGDQMDLLSSPGLTVIGPLQRISATQVGHAEVKKGAVVEVLDPPQNASIGGLYSILRRAGAGMIILRRSEQTRHLFEAFGGKTRVPIHLADDHDAEQRAALVTVSDAADKQLSALPEGTNVTLSVHARVTHRKTYNAIGYLAGSDSSSGTILLTAHLDHLGIGAPVGGDAIYNGANDDASGTTAVLELAHALAAGVRLKRSVLFVCYGSEEEGELGSEYFGQHPPVPLKNLVANLEFEMIGNQDPKMPRDTLLLTGWDRSNLGPTLKAHGAKLGPDPYPEERFFERSDNYQLALQGVVAHTAAGWGTTPTYHELNDDLAHLDLAFMTSAIQSLVEPIRWFASSDFKPQWLPGMQPHR